MNLKVKKIMVNFSYAITSNVISFLVSMLVVLIVPKVIGVEEYGYWQLYIFYAAYVAVLHLGWSDGIYLKIGGKKYEDLDKNNIFSQFYIFILFQIVVGFFVMTLANGTNEYNKKIIFIMLAITVVITNARSLLVAILQATNRIKEYAKIMMVDRITYFVMVIVLLLIGARSFELLIMADIIGRGISLIYSIAYCKDIIFRNIKKFKISINEILDNISIGIKLTLAYIASLLIIGVVRFGIELMWNVETFGKVSFSLSVSNLMMVFINAIGILLFPILKRMDYEKISNIYIYIRNLLMIVMLGLLIIYYPAKGSLSIWLPNYKESLNYMSLLFPMFIYEGKVAILINTYLKSLRKENLIMKINIVSVSISMLLTFITTYLLNDLNFSILSIIIVLAFRATLAEIVLSKIISVNIYKDIIIENILVMIFIILGVFLNSIESMILYGVLYTIYVFLKRNELKITFRRVEMLLK